MMHIYAFGSICRGEFDDGSDIDLLACVDDAAPNLSNRTYSIYRYRRLSELWAEGNPFAWHLHLESRLLFSSDGNDFLRDIGRPQPYVAVESDYAKFQTLFEQSWAQLQHGVNSATFHLSCMFLALRNFATCHSLAQGQPIFSRRSPLLVAPPLPFNTEHFATLTRARLLSTRGYGTRLTKEEISAVVKEAAAVPRWMETLRSLHERVQQQNRGTAPHTQPG